MSNADAVLPTLPYHGHRWPGAPATVPPQHTLHLWFANPTDPVNLARWEACLTQAERERADRCHRESDRRRQVSARGLLRHLLGQMFACAPQGIELLQGPHGKPLLGPVDAQRVPALHFNVSHAADGVLVGIGCGGEVGVDLEFPHPLPASDAIAQRLFGPSERSAWQAASALERQDLFFRIWTIREAYLKASGVGLSEGRARDIAIGAAAATGPVGDATAHLFRGPGDALLAAVTPAAWQVHRWEIPPGG